MLAGNYYSLYHRRFLRHLRSPWTTTTLLLSLILLGPFVALIIVASQDSAGLWVHLMETVAPRYALNTAILMLGVGILSMIYGISTAWVITRVTFPGAQIFEWALLLPATVPSYIVAYTYTDLLEYAGPVQQLLRDVFGWKTVRDYWFPEIRSMGGAIIVMSCALYPYIYVLARTAFWQTPKSYLELAQIQRPSSGIVIDISLARPAIIGGLALVLMEVLSDFGTVEYFAVETLTLGIFNIWLGMNNLAAAAQIAGIAFIFILSLIMVERAARKRQRYHDPNKLSISISPRVASTKKSILCVAVCMFPITLGFIVPVGVLANFVVRGFSIFDFPALIIALKNSISLSFFAAIIVVLIAMIMILTTSYQRKPVLTTLSTLSALGYAFPGAILAIGVVSYAGAIDDVLESVYGFFYEIPFNGFLIGGTGLLLMACIMRFQAIGHGAIVAGVNRLSPNIFGASLVLGHSFTQSILKLSPPLLSKSMMAGGLLVFVDVMKELPMTLLLRPFNYETLATFVYQYAKDELLEESSLAAIIIICSGLLPIILLNKFQR
ncbi:MAG: iron ABC transporter permease, partial [Pseudomonadota bacterium]|nr:iron ABC transporter permease [Pseudomonadota bacterium]